jgi:MarR family transcriptional regulator for hemolysin
MEITELFIQLLIDLQSLVRKNNKNLSLSLSQIVVLSSIPAMGTTMSSLSFRIGVDNSTLTRLINVLENKGLVQKTSNPKDKRSTIVRLTKLGEENVKMIEFNIKGFSKDVVRTFSSLEKGTLIDTFNKLHWNISKHKITDN